MGVEAGRGESDRVILWVIEREGGAGSDDQVGGHRVSRQQKSVCIGLVCAARLAVGAQPRHSACGWFIRGEG